MRLRRRTPKFESILSDNEERKYGFAYERKVRCTELPLLEQYTQKPSVYMETSKPSICLKLLIDTTRQRVLYAEAGKDFVDFLLTILSLPIGTIIRLLSKDGMVGSLGKLYGSVESLSSIYMQPYFNKESLLKPKATATIGVGADVLHMLTIDDSSGEKSFYYCHCRSRHQQGFISFGGHHPTVVTDNPKATIVTDNPKAICPYCSSTINTKATFVHGSAAEGETSGEGGYVKGVVTYMIMDDLEVKPMSSISSITMLNRFNVKDVGELEEKVVHLTMEEGVKLLRVSLQSNLVLTTVFLVKNEACTSTESIVE